MNNLIYGHQGDVSICYMADLSALDSLNLSNAKEIKSDDDGRKTVIMGEALDHGHRFEDSEVVDLYEYKSELTGLRRFVAVVKEDTRLIHQDVKTKELTKDHDAINLPKGIYKFGNQRQTDSEQRFTPALD